ncbi:hypothetical protein [Dyella telluris]|uniref:Uncharacterized protein n=1 Tax=Dyella telluris TaxID=2763498 RepID=A0A7G8Q820_9GAMM|nr:hypothetical protein [Dyella telluris]QNK02928.1 hypothetical protein H8F01_07390 [Dyella telluris]
MEFAQQWMGVAAGVLVLVTLGIMQWWFTTRCRWGATPLRALPPPDREAKVVLALTWDGARHLKGAQVPAADRNLCAASARLPARHMARAGALRCVADNHALAAKVFNNVPAPATSAGKYLGEALRFRTADVQRTPRAMHGLAAVNAERHPDNGGVHERSTPNASPLETFIGQTLAQWQQAIHSGRAADYADVVSRLDAMARRHPGDMGLQQSLGLCLLESAMAHADEFDRAGLLDRSIAALREVCLARDVAAEARIRLGEACYLRALIGAEADDALLREAEDSLRRVSSQEDDAAWQLQRVLRAMPSGCTREHITQRLGQAVELLASRANLAPAAERWRAALLQAEGERVEAACQNLAARRLGWRALHAQYADAMVQESSPMVLGAWAGLLCAMAEHLRGNAAIERFREVDATLERLRAMAGESEAYVRAWVRLAIGRARLQDGTQSAEMLARADAMLQPFLTEGDEWRLLACRLGLSRAVNMGAARARALYQRVVELGRPLTAVPSLTIDALRCVLAALLALDEEKDRLVFARCLAVVAEPGDAESLRLLAENDLRVGDFRQGCLRAEQAWRGGSPLPQSLLDRWQDALATWASREAGSLDLAGNRSCLRMARIAMGGSAPMARSVV